MIIIAITGASGVIYGVELLKALKQLKIETGLLISNPAKIVIEYELEESVEEIKSLADHYFESEEIDSSVNSGSFKFDSAVIIPCSMKTVSAIANGYASNSITRLADVALKERRTLVLVPRETPLRDVHLENMLRISKEGGIILPAMPAFYHDPKDISDMTNFIVGKVLDVLKIDNDMFKRWEKE
ncbi:3-polyprenyl-4-hydroxybenzoate decarboxylase UbiX [Methanobrevibacter ruminantium M1]|uniref:Flavin prenyltransferase UbiX n=1 Tax=Methanobrevibacter ruminantium (strain ATCC 35063 / DSM 1093 / JCM 13430 / OCM 146 / M1) TaxID=634498 RepID=D3E3L4_METRM|nr:UbiX family flavin prenyltransferase [Methanobrevibacter ruminantium]ADC47125.1 3-polyprenyl-4-hydroxybenzoate decarboxylase UbiX [Methanobrevibacter ruminantium M1]